MSRTKTLEAAESTCLVQSRDFVKTTTDSHYARNEWHAGHMRHVIAALDGTPVAIVLDTQTGHMPVGVKLVGMGYSAGYGSPTVVVEYPHADGTSHRTAHLLMSVGVIVPLVKSDAKWIATKSVSDECSKAVDIARPIFEAEGRNYGKYETRPTQDAGQVSISYTPQRDDAGTRTHRVIDTAKEAATA